MLELARSAVEHARPRLEERPRAVGVEHDVRRGDADEGEVFECGDVHVDERDIWGEEVEERFWTGGGEEVWEEVGAFVYGGSGGQRGGGVWDFRARGGGIGRREGLVGERNWGDVRAE